MKISLRIFLATLALSAAFSSSAFALEPKSLGEVCDRITSSEGTVRCIAAAQGKYIDGLAAAACDRMTTTGSTVSCIGVIAGKRYSPDIVMACDRIQGAESTIACLAAGGTYTSNYPSHSGQYQPGQNHNVRALVQRAIRAIQEGRINEALQILYSI